MNRETREFRRLEKRTLQINPTEIRALEEDLVITGKINSFNYSKPMVDLEFGQFLEIVPKSTWDDAISRNKDIKLYVNHNDCVSVAESMELWTDEQGVYFKARLIENARTLFVKVKEGLVNSLSFGFVCLQDKWQKMPTHSLREVLKIELHEVSCLDGLESAYPNTELTTKIDILNNKELIGVDNNGNSNSNDNSNISNDINSEDDKQARLEEMNLMFEEINLLKEQIDLLY